MSESESDVPSVTEQSNSRKRKRDPSKYMRNKIKVARIKGELYVNHKGNSVEAKKPCLSCG